MSHLLHHYLAKAIHEERIEDARRARLVRAVAFGRRQEPRKRFSMSGVLGWLSRGETAPVCVSGSNYSVCAS